MEEEEVEWAGLQQRDRLSVACLPAIAPSKEVLASGFEPTKHILDSQRAMRGVINLYRARPGLEVQFHNAGHALNRGPSTRSSISQTLSTS